MSEGGNQARVRASGKVADTTAWCQAHRRTGREGGHCQCPRRAGPRSRWWPAPRRTPLSLVGCTAVFPVEQRGGSQFCSPTCITLRRSDKCHGFVLPLLPAVAWEIEMKKGEFCQFKTWVGDDALVDKSFLEFKVRWLLMMDFSVQPTHSQCVCLKVWLLRSRFLL